MKSKSSVTRTTTNSHNTDERRDAMKALIGIRKNSPIAFNTEEYIRSLRRGVRLERLKKK